MGTKISWAEETWNPIVGCSKISAGCANCYAEKMALRLAAMECCMPYVEPKYLNVVTSDKTTRGWTGQTHFVESALTKPLHWRKPRKIFICSMSDLFQESVPFEWIDRVFAVMALCPQHTFMVLTKRAERMREYIERTGKSFELLKAACPEGRAMEFQGIPLIPWPLPNVHLGGTVENQDNVGRIADLIQTLSAKRFISLEPLLEEISITDIGYKKGCEWWCPACGEFSEYPEEYEELLEGESEDEEQGICPNCGHSYSTGVLAYYPFEHFMQSDKLYAVGQHIDYAFVGCESGAKARLCTLDNIREMICRCQQADIEVHVKQIPLDGKCNKNIDEWPKEFQIREI